MIPMSLQIITSGELRLPIQIMTLVLALIVIHMSDIESRRNQNKIYKYLALGFGFLLVGITTTTTAFSLSLWTGLPKLPPLVYIAEHILTTAGYIYIAAAFISVKSGVRSGFLRMNFLTLAVFTIIVLTTWFVYGLDPRIRIWRDISYEIWIVSLLITTVVAIMSSKVRMKWGLIIATCLLLSKHAAHVTNTIILLQQSPALLLIEYLAPAFYYFAIIMTLHREIITDLQSADLEKIHVKEKAYRDTIRALINSLEAKDEYTRGHSDRVTEYTMVAGQKLGLNQEELTNLYYGAILHDIGKIGVSEEILNNPFTLRGDDLNSIKKHPEIGATIISSIESLKHVASVVLHHHERYDGLGYPTGLKAEDIPLHSRIISISDALDAMLSDRTYRDSLTEEKAVRELVAGAGSQFDPFLIRVFLEALKLPVKESDLKKLEMSA